ncbi:hypothetical protein NBRC116601_26270 [Cognatishimia sp. WU-CL00825]|uniref:hypothetical protein n=1 Tax=Cognatishimia sp. WU-CL00825 TaxID=3127658 RepID=UPI003108502B
MAALPEIASLWIGGNLSWLEQLCLKSFADAGHHITLYSYEPIDNLPKGVHAGDAAVIFPAEPMYRHAVTGSPAIHADFWRMRLLQTTDKLWVDADVLCYRAFDYDQEHVFGWEKKNLVCNAVLGLPKDSPALANMMAFFEDPYAIGPWLKDHQQAELRAERDAGHPVHMTQQDWGFTGPKAVSWFLKQSDEIKHAQDVEAFYAKSFKDRNHFILSRHNPEDYFTQSTRGVHLWARRLKPRLRDDENNKPRRGSFLHRMLDKHDIRPADAPIPPKQMKFFGSAQDPRFRAMLAVEALKNDEPVAQLAKNNGVSPAQIREWRSQLVSNAVKLFQ